MFLQNNIKGMMLINDMKVKESESSKETIEKISNNAITE